MRSTSFAAVFALALSASAARAQLAESAGYTLGGFDLVGAAGGTASLGHAGFASLDAVGGVELASPGFTAQVGFLGAHDPGPTLAPFVFGVLPAHGPTEGGTPIAVSGLNFEKLGSAAPVFVDVAGVPATAVIVRSDTTIQAVTPAGESGPGAVTVSSSFGSGELSGAFLHTPAVVTPPSALLGTVLDIADYGPVGSIYQVNFSPFETSIPLPPYGTLLIGPTSVFALALLVYPGPDGVGTLPLFLPEDPTLSGVTLHFQSLAVISLSPLDARLTNRSSTLLL